MVVRGEHRDIVSWIPCLTAFGVVMLAVLWLASCRHRPAPLPKTYPVHGKVTCVDGEAVRDGLVQFQPDADPTVTTTATIQGDGIYRLATLRDGLKTEGAVAGPNRVMVIVTHVDAAGTRDAISTVFPTPYLVAPRDNEFNLTIERPR